MHKITMRLLPLIAVTDFRVTESAISFNCGMGALQSMPNEIVSIYDGTSFQYFHYNKSNIIPLNDYVGHHRIYVNEDYIYIKDWYKLMAININEECFEQHLDDLFKSYGVKGTLVNFFVDESGNYWMLTDDDVLLYRVMPGERQLSF